MTGDSPISAMLDLADIPFFESLSSESLAQLRQRVPVRQYPQGSVIARAGDQGKYFQAIASGAVWVQPTDSNASKNRGVFLGPGQVFGEMSLFSGAPVSATLVATKDTATYCIDGPTFLQLLENEPMLHSKITKILIERLRKQTQVEQRYPGLIVLAYPFESEQCTQFATIVEHGILHYAPGAELFSELRSGLGDIDDQGLLPASVLRWRETAARGQFLVIRVRPRDLDKFANVFEPKDVVLGILESHANKSSADVGNAATIADYSCVYIGDAPQRDHTLWAFRVPHGELTRAREHASRWAPAAVPNIDKVARYLTFKEIGIAMSSGAARGFAHLGVLEVLEENGIPYDTMCGSSMGGIVALTVAHKRSVVDAVAQVREQLGANKKIRDPLLLPRGSLFAGRKVARAAEVTFRECTFADLSVPTAVVAADLLRGERVIINRGPVAPAVLATSAIPGFFPPIAGHRRLMVDGGVVSHVPVDVLDHRRCGLRIAINVLQLPTRSQADIFTDASGLQRKLVKPLGLKSVLGAAWELLGSWGSSNEALQAEIVISPKTPARAGYNFDQFETIVESGRAAARERVEAVADLIDSMKRS